jgi:hypothetical protein
MKEVVEFETESWACKDIDNLDEEEFERFLIIFRQSKEYGYSGIQLSNGWHKSVKDVVLMRKFYRILPVYKLVDTCATELQFAIKDGEIYVIEVNPRASRTVPFVSKAQGQPFAKIAAMAMAELQKGDWEVRRLQEYVGK